LRVLQIGCGNFGLAHLAGLRDAGVAVRAVLDAARESSRQAVVGIAA
jgi:ketol-acid reductoisomerase